VKWTAGPRVDEDLIAARDFIGADNERAAIAFLDTAFEIFDLLSRFPEMGPSARLKHRRLKGVRFFVLPHPFNRWIVFYRSMPDAVEIIRVIYGAMNWRIEPERFF
jgi:plasmid stabilization system protein ParE